MHFWRDVEGRFALTDAAVLLAGLALLLDFDVQGDVELFRGGQQGLDVLARLDSEDCRSKARAKERVAELLADDGAVGAADAEDVGAARDFGVSQQCSAGHGTIPIAVETS